MRVQNRWTKGIGTGVGLVLLLASAAGFGEPPSNADSTHWGPCRCTAHRDFRFSLTNVAPPRRLHSSEAAFDWAYRSLKDDGLTRVQRQTVPIQDSSAAPGPSHDR